MNEVRAALQDLCDAWDHCPSKGHEGGKFKGNITMAQAVAKRVLEKTAALPPLRAAGQEWRDISTMREALDRYRYVYHWWASDSYDRGGEFNARMNWARGEDIADDLTANQFAEIGQRFLARTGRLPAPPVAEPPPGRLRGHIDLMVTPESIDAFMEKNPLPDEPIVAEKQTVKP